MKIVNKNIILAVVLLIIVLPFSASAFYFGGEKALGLAGAYIAVADDTCAIFMNPAGMSQSKSYVFDVNYQVEKKPDAKLWGVSLLDSQTGTLAMGLGYYKKGRNDPNNLLSDRDENFVIALSEAYSPRLLLGLNYKYIKQRGPWNNDDTMDVGLLFKPSPQFSIGLTGKNLISTDIDEVHKLYTAGVAYRTGVAGLSFDITKDDSTKTERDVMYSYGMEGLFLKSVIMRTGYMTDKRVGKKFYSFNVGWAFSGFSVGYAYLRDEVDTNSSIHTLSLKLI